MKKMIVFSILISFIFASTVIAGVLHKSSPGVSTVDPQKDFKSKIGLLKLPFIKNEAQINDPKIKYYVNIISGNVFVEDDAVTYSLVERRGPGGWTIREKLLGSKETRVEGMKPSPTKVNIFKGKEQKNWLSNIPTYEELSFGEVYDHIRLNLKAYGNNMEKIFVVENGGDPKNIALQIEGAKGLKVNNDGELEIETGIGTLKMTAPLAFQEIDGKRIEVAAAYELKASSLQETDPRNIYGFKLGEYDKTKKLIIDPLLAWTFLGGTKEDKTYAIALSSTEIIGDGKGNDDEICDSNEDCEENVFITGTTRSTDFPTTVGAYDNTYNNNMDIFISKFDKDLTTLLASTYLGGSGNDYSYSIAVSVNGNVYITGDTNSANTFPTTLGVYQIILSGAKDAIVSKLDGSLSTLLASTFIGGSGNDYGRSIGIDSAGNVFITGYTDSSGPPATPVAFPTTLGAYRTTLAGNEDAFVSKLDLNLNTLIASSFLGGSDSDYAYALTIATNGDIFITGTTASIDYPTSGVTYSSSNAGQLDVFISRLNSTLTSLVASTYLGGADHDVAKAIAINSEGDVFITGWTASEGDPNATPPIPPFPTTPGAYDRANNSLFDRNVDVFVSKFNSYLSILKASTLLGGNDGEEANGIVINSEGDVFVTGWTASEGDPNATPMIPSFPTTQGAYDSTLNGEGDGFVVQFDPNLTTLLSSTIFGGESHDIGQGIALDSQTNVYVAGSTHSYDFPRPPQFIDPPLFNYMGSWDAFIIKFTPDFLSQYMLTLNKGGTGGGTVISIPTGIHCENDCQQISNLYNYGLKVKLIATPREDSMFDLTGWTGGCIVEDSTKPWECTATMNTNLTIGVQFILKTYTITVTADTGGTVSPVGPVTLQYGANQNFSITPNVGYFLADVIVDGVSVSPTPPKYGTYIYPFTNVTSNRTIRAVFRPNPVIQVTADAGGTISPPGPVTLQYNASQSFTITPNAGYVLADLLVDGASVLPAPQYSPYIHNFTNVTTDRTIRAVFRSNPVIQTTADAGGTISPVGPVTLQYGANQSFSMTPNVGYFLADVLVDGKSVDPTPPKYGTYIYPFTNVTSDRTIRAVFRPNPVIQVTADAGGSILPTGPVTLQYDASQNFSMTPNAGYALADLLVDGVSVLSEPKYSTYVYALNNVKTDRTIRAVFRSNPVIQTTADAGGTISPVGPVTVQYGGGQSFSMTPNIGYFLADVIVDGVSVSPAPPKYGTYIYPFTNVTSGRTIRAVFRPNPVVQVTADAGGSILPTGPVTLQYDASQSFSMTPNAGYALADLLVDGVSVLSEPKYSTYVYALDNVKTDRTIRAVFRSNPVIQTTADAGGTISPVGPVTVQYGGGQSFSMTPNAGYFLADVIVDGVSVSPTPPKYGTYNYAFTNVTSGRTIRVVFRPNPVIQVTADAGGTILPTGPVTLQYGANLSFSMTPNAGYALADLLVDGVSVLPEPQFSTYIYNLTNVTTDRTIRAVFRPNPVIQTTADAGGTISPVGPVTVQYGANQSFIITPNSGYYLSEVSVDGNPITPAPPKTGTTYTFNNVINGHTIRAVFRNNPVIQAVANSGGTINPTGSVSIKYGGSQTFSISPAVGSYLVDVIVDGTSVSPHPPLYGVYTYTFTDVTSDRTIQAIFQSNPVIQTTADTGGTISPAGPVTVQYGASQTFFITPNSGYYLAEVSIDGNPVTPAPPKYGTFTYTFTNIVIGHSVRAAFRANPVIQAVADSGGMINPSGSVSVQYGGSQSFTIYPTEGYYLADVIVDGSSVNPPPPLSGAYTYTFTGVTYDRSIRAIISPNPIIELSAGDGGTIFPSGTQSVSYGSCFLITVTPSPGYFISGLLIDGESVGPFAGYLLKNVTQGHKVEALFTQEKPQGLYTIIATSGPEGGGIIRPFGINDVRPLNKKVFKIKPSDGYHIKDVIVDGQSRGPLSSYTFAKVSASHTIDVLFDTEKTLTITKTGSGQGTITSKPRGISCGTDCKQIYDTDDLVLLVPKPSSDSVFSGWSGGGCGGTDTCTVKMSGDIEVTAIFSPK